MEKTSSSETSATNNQMTRRHIRKYLNRQQSSVLSQGPVLFRHLLKEPSLHCVLPVLCFSSLLEDRTEYFLGFYVADF
jgi:hypothetical protein